jgi:S-formylglutathione hydrolase
VAAPDGVRVLSEQRCFGGVQGRYEMDSTACAGPMRFSVYQPPAAAVGRVPVLYFLAGLTCTEETFMLKAGAQRVAAELGLMLVAPDTSPRDTGIADATGDWEFGEGAGFYLDATQAPYAARFRMYSFVACELPALVERAFPADPARRGIAGHSMGGHGALTIALKHPDRYASVSAFAPIVAPSQVPWGRKAFPRYLGDDPQAWRAHDACALLEDGARFPGTLRVDQGEADDFLATQLQPERLERACAAAGQPLDLRRHAGYDHGYWFVQSFVEAHLRHHAAHLQAGAV